MVFFFFQKNRIGFKFEITCQVFNLEIKLGGTLNQSCFTPPDPGHVFPPVPSILFPDLLEIFAWPGLMPSLILETPKIWFKLLLLISYT